MTPQEIIEALREENPDALLADGFDAALVQVAAVAVAWIEALDQAASDRSRRR